MDSRHSIRDYRLEKATWLFTGIGLVASLGLIGSKFFLFRPVADDYCFAASLNDGFFSALSYWYQNVQFDFFVLTSNLVFVAIPIQIFPVNLASLATFLMGVSLFAYFLSHIFAPGGRQNFKAVGLKFFIYWLGAVLSYFAIQASLLNNAKFLINRNFGSLSEFIAKVAQHTNDVTNSWAFWGVVNSSYLIPFILSFLYLLRITSDGHMRPTLRLFLSFLIGGAGYVIASTTFLTLIVICILQSRSQHNLKLKETSKNILSSILKIKNELLLIIFGVLLSYFSPGGNLRRKSLADLADSERITIDSLLSDVSIIVGEILLNVGNVFAVIFGLFIATLFNREKELNLDRVVHIFNISRVYLVVGFVMTVVSEMFSYRAYWHTFTLRFVFLIFLVSYIVSSLTRSLRLHTVDPKFYLVVPVFFLVSLLGLADQASQRYEAWTLGKNFGALASIGYESGWVSGCSEKLKESNPSKFYPEVRE